MSPLNISLGELITKLDEDLPDAGALEKISEAQLRSHTLNALGDQLVGHYVSEARQEGASWTEIGDAIGVSKQAAQQRHSPQAFERFTNLARHAIVLSQESARGHRHDYIGTEHMLLGLLGEPGGLAYELLVQKAGSEEAVRKAVEEQLGPESKKTPRGHIAFTPKAKQAIQESIRASKDLGHSWVGTEHVLLGLLAVPTGAAAIALATLGIDVDTVKPTVVDEITRRMAEPRQSLDS
jgi:hypothetical protein